MSGMSATRARGPRCGMRVLDAVRACHRRPPSRGGQGRPGAAGSAERRARRRDGTECRPHDGGRAGRRSGADRGTWAHRGAHGEPVDRPRVDGVRHVRRVPRHHHPVHRVCRHRGGLRQRGDLRAVVGAERVHHRLRGHAHPGRAPGGPHRAATDVSGRGGGVHRGVHALRSGAHGGRSGGRADAAGGGRGRAGAVFARAGAADLSAGPGAARGGGVERRGRGGGRAGPHAGRRGGGAPRMAVGVLHQPSRRHHQPAAGHAGAAGGASRIRVGFRMPPASCC